MADQQSDLSWTTPAFRQRIIAQIDEVIRQSGNPINKTSIEMENHVYDRARTKDEYLGYVARLILHAREMNAFNKKNISQNFGMSSDGITNLDPLNALQSMTQTGTNMNLAPSMAPRNPEASSSMPSGLHSALTTPLSVKAIGMTKASGKMGTAGSSQPSPGQSSQGQFSAGTNYGNARTPQPASIDTMQGSPYVSHSPRQIQLSAGGHSRGIPSPAQFTSGSFNSQMTPSPLGYMQSHSPHLVPSPGPHQAMMATPRATPGPMTGLSPGSALGTPASMSQVAASPEDQVYLEKVRQLSKYIEPLERIIARIEKDSDKKKELSKMTSLRDILTNHTHKRLPFESLLKCEQVLEKMELHVRASDASASVSAAVAPTDPQAKEYNLCQPLYDAVVAHINLPTFSHTLQRTFGPAVAALHGRRSPSPPAKRRRNTDEEAPDIPDVIQGEIARLDRRFKINLNPTHHSGSRTVHLVCQLDDKNLPCVPPIMIMVPDVYPLQSPQCTAKFCDYGSTDFLQTIYHNLTTRLAELPSQYSITSVLDTWEMSVRQACAPPSKTANEAKTKD